MPQGHPPRRVRRRRRSEAHKAAAEGGGGGGGGFALPLPLHCSLQRFSRDHGTDLRSPAPQAGAVSPRVGANTSHPGARARTPSGGTCACLYRRLQDVGERGWCPELRMGSSGGAGGGAAPHAPAAACSAIRIASTMHAHRGSTRGGGIIQGLTGVRGMGVMLERVRAAPSQEKNGFFCRNIIITAGARVFFFLSSGKFDEAVVEAVYFGL